MKKIAYAALFVSGLTCAATASAAGTAITSAPITGNATGACVLLGEDITVNLSNNVHGAYTCDEANSIIKVATCHEAGSRKIRDIQCRSVGTAADGTTIWNISGCTATTDIKKGITAYNAYIASSRGGSVAPTPLDGACSDTTAGSLAFFN